MAYAKIGTYRPVAFEAQEKAVRRLELRREIQDKFSSDKFFIWAFLISFLSMLFEVSMILVSWNKLPPQLPLFWLHPWGETRLAPPMGLWILPALVSAVSIVNFLLALAVWSESKFLSRVLIGACIVIAAATFYDTIKTISLVT